jgi:hypothetical protein
MQGFFAFLQDDEHILTHKAFNILEYLVDHADGW